MAKRKSGKNLSAGKSRRGRGRLRRLVNWALMVAALAFLFFEAGTWPRVSALKTKTPKTTAFIERYKKQRIHEGKKPWVSWQWRPYSQISPNLKQAVIVAEDINFFSHHGFDFESLWEAVKESFKEREVPRGASTISQQVAKNLWLSPSRNPFRKLKEAALTFQLERTLSKRRILEIYLNIAEFGPGIYGCPAAARYYFKKDAGELTEDEAAALAASLPFPSYWHPGCKDRYYNWRVNLIRQRMAKATFVKKYL